MISIITPVYKAEPFIDRCIQSVLSQSYVDWELILVNDGSPDNSLEICRRYAEVDQRIRVFTQENQGASVARNLALDQVRGEYIAFLDSDDTLNSDTLEYVMQALEEHEACDIVQFPMRGAVGRPTEHDVAVYDTICIGVDQVVDMGKQEHLTWWITNKIFRRHIFDDVRFIPGMLYEDNLVCLEAIVRSRGCACISKGRYNYHWNPNSVTKVPTRKNYTDMTAIHGLMYLEAFRWTNSIDATSTFLRKFCGEVYSSLRRHNRLTDVAYVGAKYIRRVPWINIWKITDCSFAEKLRMALVKIFAHTLGRIPIKVN